MGWLGYSITSVALSFVVLILVFMFTNERGSFLLLFWFVFPTEVRFVCLLSFIAVSVGWKEILVVAGLDMLTYIK